MVGTRTATSYRLGDLVEVELLEAAPFAGALRFEIVGRRGRDGQRPLRGGRAPFRQSSNRATPQGQSGLRKGGKRKTTR